MWNTIEGWLVGVLILGVVLIVINVILLFSGVGNLRRIFFIRQLQKLLGGIPDDVLLACQSQEVVAMGYDRESNKEKVIPLYSGIITWTNGPRVTRRVKQRVRKELSWRIVVF